MTYGLSESSDYNENTFNIKGTVYWESLISIMS